MAGNNNSGQPAALFLRQPHSLLNNWDNFIKFADGRFEAALWDPSRPFAEQVKGVQVIIDDGGSQHSHELIDESKKAGVKLWHTTTNGLDHVDVAYFVQVGMPLAHAAGPQSAIALAEHALAVIFYFNKNLHHNRGQVWSSRLLNGELKGQVLGLIGLGASARELAKRASGLGMRIRAVDIYPVPDEVRRQYSVDWFGSPDQLGEMAREVDFLSVHVPITSKTHKMVNRDIFAVMKPNAVMINPSRGAIIDEAALIEALQSKQIKGAGIDVYDPEPPAPTNPLLNMPNVLATPHVAGATDGTWRRRSQAAVENVLRVLRGETPHDLVKGVE
jgi:D-3-phosphoglycerate dehydrogenase